MKHVPFTAVLSVFTLGFCLVSASCANSSPELVSVSASVIFEYADEKSAPHERLAVFAETGSDARRVESLKAVSRTNNYEWTAESPVVFGSDNRQWAGYSDFVCPGTMEIPQGLYDLYYTDGQEKSVQAVFAVTYPPELKDAKMNEVPEKLGPFKREMVAAYLEDGELFYYDSKKPSWNTDNDIWNEFKQAASIRHCWTLANNSVICIMPEIKRPSADGLKK